jgi:hypothetical protein
VVLGFSAQVLADDGECQARRRDVRLRAVPEDTAERYF